MPGPTLYPRLAEPRLLEALADSPVSLIHGPRQCGKTTFAQIVGGPRGYSYFTFDDDVVRDAAGTDPAGFVNELPERAILDEVQRVPELFTALKATVDRERRAGRFILTGSTNVLLVPQLADSLTGRMDILRLHPLAQCELTGSSPRFLDSMFDSGFGFARTERLGARLAEVIVAGGYPAALARATPRRRGAWYRNYIETLVQRDVRDLSRIRSLDALPRLLTLAAARTAQLLNVSDLASPFQVSRPTIRDYLTILERVFLLETIAPWHSNRVRRLVKTPKLHLGDTGLACALLGLDGRNLAKDRTRLGPLLESFVFQELRRQASWRYEPLSFFHYRDKDGAEVDIVIESGAGTVAGVEVKAGATVRAGDFHGLRKLERAAAGRFVRGVVLYDGEARVPFGNRLHAVPLRALWESG